MEGDYIKINKWLTPLSWIYGLGVKLRNLLFDTGLRKSHKFKTPVISIGNITVGGTGKTPHVEYLVRLLQERVRVAVLSRGYKRKSKGFIVAKATTAMQDIGDEPYQMKQKFPKITVAVDKCRVDGINRLTNNDSKHSHIDVVLLDDAFQHRQVKPGINILLVDYHRLLIYDKLLPAGRLREPLKGKSRADIVIVTKCPKELKPVEYRVIIKALDLYPYQQLFFSTLDYEQPKPVFKDAQALDGDNALSNTNVLLLTGIASPRQLAEDLMPQVKSITPLTFGDHHAFNFNDIVLLDETFSEMPSPKCIITTEKDAVRLLTTEELSDDIRQHLYQIPIRISFLLDQQEAFDQFIIDYVQTNVRRRIKPKAKDEHKTKNARKSNNKSRTIKFN